MQTFAQRRLQGQEQAAPEVRLGDLRIVRDTLQVFLGEREVSLTVQEFDLLLLLARSPGKPQPQDELSHAMWGEATAQRKRHLSVLVARLRSKLTASRSYQLRTVRKRGYSLDAAD
jgi:two-component system alkaline phosphatase synthesis response regulator PhoP